MLEMMITGKLGIYKCRATPVGPFAVVEIYKEVEKQKSTWFGLGATVRYTEEELVWEGDSALGYSASTRWNWVKMATPKDIRAWYHRVLKQYEDREIAWSQ